MYILSFDFAEVKNKYVFKNKIFFFKSCVSILDPVRLSIVSELCHPVRSPQKNNITHALMFTPKHVEDFFKLLWP